MSGVALNVSGLFTLFCTAALALFPDRANMDEQGFSFAFVILLLLLFFVSFALSVAGILLTLREKAEAEKQAAAMQEDLSELRKTQRRILQLLNGPGGTAGPPGDLPTGIAMDLIQFNVMQLVTALAIPLRPIWAPLLILLAIVGAVFVALNGPSGGQATNAAIGFVIVAALGATAWAAIVSHDIRSFRKNHAKQ